MTESKVWIIAERLISLITILVLAFAVWNTLLRIESSQAKQHKQVNETLEAIRERIGNEELWQQVKPNLESTKQP